MDITHRWITHWHDKGLLLNDKPSQKWRTFNLSEFLWLRMIVKLRAVGVELARIKAIRDFLVAPIQWTEFEDDLTTYEVVRDVLAKDSIHEVSDAMIKEAIKELPEHPVYRIQNWMELFMLDVMITKEPFSLIVDWKNQVRPHRWNYPTPVIESDESNASFIDHSFISLSMTDLIAEVIARQTSLTHDLFPSFFSEAEWQLLLFIHEGKASEIQLIQKNGRVEKMEITESVKVEQAQRLCEIFTGNSYQEFSAQMVDGHVVSGNLTTKLKFK